MLVPNDIKTKTQWHSLRQICDRVIATIERRPGFPTELYLTPRQALMLMSEQITIMRRILKIKEPA